jgi:hypothetical protein
MHQGLRVVVHNSRTLHQTFGPQFQSLTSAEIRRKIAAVVSSWHIAKFFCHAKLGRYQGMADIEQASPRSIWLKLPTSLPYLYGEPLTGRVTSGQGRWP